MRIPRWLITSILAALVVTAPVLAGTAGPASAHGGVALTVNDDGRGNVSVDVVWLDGHPVTETIAGTLSAVSDAGQQVGPVALARLPGRPTVVYGTPLAAGIWQVTVDVAVPGIGFCRATVRAVAADVPATPGTTQCGTPAPPAPAAAPDPGPSDAGWPAWATVLLVVLAVAVLAGAVWFGRSALGRSGPRRGTADARRRDAAGGGTATRERGATGRGVTGTAAGPRSRSSGSRRRS